MENQEAVKVNTERLFMRTITDDDAATVANLFSDEFETENAALEHIRWINNNAYENRLVFNFYIWLKGTEDCIGRVYIHSKPELGGEVEIGYGISEIYRNKGYATEAARVMVDYAFEKLGQEVLVAIVKPENTPSRCVIKKLGFSDCGTKTAPDENGVMCEFDYFRLYKDN